MEQQEEELDFKLMTPYKIIEMIPFTNTLRETPLSEVTTAVFVKRFLLVTVLSITIAKTQGPLPLVLITILTITPTLSTHQS